MIKYNLKCGNDHEFESWFSNSEEFEKLNNKGLLDCIYCSSKKIKKSIMSPMIANSKTNNDQVQLESKDLKNQKKQLLLLRKYIEKNFKYVGKDFGKGKRTLL